MNVIQPGPDGIAYSPRTDIGRDIHALASELFPLCRSLTGSGVRETLDILSRHVPIERQRVASGERLFDWTAPKEWTIRDAFVKDSSGQRVIDFAASNLHVVSYSTPIHRIMPLSELRTHLYTLPAQPDLIPYRTCYYTPDWGFCMSHDALLALCDGDYEVCIDSELSDGYLDYGEYVYRGEGAGEFLLSAHICHPSLANDNCSGLALLARLAADLAGRRTRYSYRFLFAPGTIGALAWLVRNEDRVEWVKHGLVVSCVGDGGGPTYKRSRRGNAFVDRAMIHVLHHSGLPATVADFSPYGYDERQFCSPGFDMPVGLFQNSAFGTFPEYHTSGDNLDFIRPEHLERSYRLIMQVIDIIESEWIPLNLLPHGEPQLGRRGLYRSVGGDKAAADAAMAILWVLNLADGRNGLLDIAERSRLPFPEVARAASELKRHGLLGESGGQSRSRSDIVEGSYGQLIPSTGSS